MQYLLTKEFSKINETSGATFDINYPVFYNATATSDGAAMSTGLYFAIGSVNLRTLTGDTERTFDAKKPLYLKGTLSGNIFTVHSDVITTSTPSTNDGFTYLRVGFTYSDYQAYVAVFCNELFAYKDGAFKKFDPFAESYSLPTASASTKGGIKIGNGLSMIGDTLNVSLGGVLDSVPSSVDGGLWFETTSTAPIIKFKQGGSTYYLYTNQLVSPNLTLSSSTVTATSGASQTVTLTYSGEGTITLSNPNTSALTATYNSSTKTITLTSNLTSGSSVVNLGVNLSESGNYAADSQTLAVTCSAEPLDPQLTLSTYNTSLASRNASTTVTVSYLGTGTISVTSSTYAVIPFYNSSTKTITLQATNEPVMDYSVTITVSLSAAGAYASATATITNTDKAKPE